MDMATLNGPDMFLLMVTVSEGVVVVPPPPLLPPPAGVLVLPPPQAEARARVQIIIAIKARRSATR